MRSSLAVKLIATTSLLGLATATPALAANGTVERFSGVDRYATAVEISAEFEGDVDVVYVANGLDFPDALSAAPAAASQGGPLLLTPPSDLPDDVAEAIEELEPELIVVVGGTSSVSAAVFDELRNTGSKVRRDAGANRYETSRIVNQMAFLTTTTGGAFFADGRGFPDALGASAAAAKNDDPVVLVNGSEPAIDPATVELIERLGITSAKIAGGEATVSAGIQVSVAAAVGGSADRLAGADRYATSQVINRATFQTADEVYFAGGVDFADALAGGALAGFDKAPLYIVPSSCVSAEVRADVTAFGNPDRFLLGGPSRLGAGVENLEVCATPAPIVPPEGPTPTMPADKDCPDFATSADAQAFYLRYLPYYGDVSRLDRDNDGYACEFNPDL